MVCNSCLPFDNNKYRLVLEPTLHILLHILVTFKFENPESDLLSYSLDQCQKVIGLVLELLAFWLGQVPHSIEMFSVSVHSSL